MPNAPRYVLDSAGRAVRWSHASQNLGMRHTLKRSVTIPCGSNTQDFDMNPFSVRGSCLKPSHQLQMKKRTNSYRDREAARFTLRSTESGLRHNRVGEEEILLET
jgi:hypothetical protein